MTTIVLVGLVAGAAVGAVGLVRGWRSPVTSDYYRQPTFWPWGEAAWHGFRRTDLIGECFVVVLAIAVGFPEAVAYWGLVVLTLMLLGLTVFLFNRPRLLVPPALREQPGFLTTVLTRR